MDVKKNDSNNSRYNNYVNFIFAIKEELKTTTLLHHLRCKSPPGKYQNQTEYSQ